MGEKTGISWTHHTFSPWHGCVKISPACDYCYAELQSKRYGHDVWGMDADRRFLSDHYWRQPHKWNAAALEDGVRRRVFCASMADVFEDRRALDPWREKLWKLIRETPNLDWLLLTKRPQNIMRLMPADQQWDPLPNIWLGTTVEHPDYFWRIDALLKTPAVIHFISAEPLLARLLGLHSQLQGRIQWVIAGGESGSKARPSHPDWFRHVRDVCVNLNIPFHFKQFGEHNDQLVRIGRKAAGNTLDGVQWLQFPDLQAAAARAYLAGGHLSTLRMLRGGACS